MTISLRVQKRRPLTAGFLLLALACTASDVSGPSTGGPQVTAAAGGNPSVSGRIAFVSDRDGNLEIYVMSANGTGVTRLTNNPANDQQPTWSPYGSKLAFVTDRDGNDEIYVMNANGTGVIRLTENAAYDDAPAWSPRRACGGCATRRSTRRCRASGSACGSGRRRRE